MKRALILPGGGSWGEVQAGALFNLELHGLLKGITHVYANSAGSLNAGILLKSLLDRGNASLLKEAWDAITKDEDVYTPGFTAVALHPWAHPISEAQICHGLINGQSAFDNSPLQALVKKYMGDTSTKEIEEKLGIIYRARAYHNEEGQRRILAGMLRHMALCSSAIEGAFPPHLGFSDGGPVENNPAGDAIDAGADEILVVYCGAESPRPNDEAFWLDDFTPPAAMKTGVQVCLGVLSNITTINEAMTEARLEKFEKAGGKVVECYSRVSVPGSILDFSKQGRWDLGANAAELAAIDAAKLGW
jgi:predicted acylesterase/phospholipase RssA